MARPAARPPRRARTGPGVLRLLRAGLLLLTVLAAGQGVWMLAAPRSFYNDIPTVAADPPFNEHLMTDIGGLVLAMAVILGASALLMERNLIRAALVGYLVYAVSHLLFHATHLHGIPGTDAVALVTALSLLPALALVLLILAGRARASAGRVTTPRPGDPGSTPAGRDSRGRPW